MATRKTPTAKVITDNNPEKSVTDVDGRVIRYRPLNVLEQFRLSLAMGADKAENAAAMRIATVAAMVTSIDDVPCPKPTNFVTVESAIARLGDSGLVALVMAADTAAGELEARTAGPLDSQE